MATKNPVLDTVERTAATWRDEAERRKRLTKLDPAAEVLEHCADEIVMLARDAERADVWLTVEQFAELPHVRVTAQTVRAWIRAGQLDARNTTKGYIIKRDAVRRSAQKAS